MEDDQGKTVGHGWTFSHDDDNDGLKFAQDLVREEFGEEHVADLDWDDCYVRYD